MYKEHGDGAMLRKTKVWAMVVGWSWLGRAGLGRGVGHVGHGIGPN